MKKTKTKNAAPDIKRHNKALKNQIFFLENQVEQLIREVVLIEAKIKALS